MDVENILARASEHLSVRRAFGPAYEKDGLLIIPVALVTGGGGGGTGSPRTRRADSAPQDSAPQDSAPQDSAPQDSAPQDSAPQDSAPQDSGAMDSGGGFGGLVLPSGAYVVKGDQVRWVPAIDPTIVTLASLSLVRVLARAWARRGGRRGRP
jgi:hypothetical protein